MNKVLNIFFKLLVFIGLTACSQVSHNSIEYWRTPASILTNSCQDAIRRFAVKSAFEKDSLKINGVVRHWESVGDDGVIALMGGRDIDSAVKTIISEAKEKIYIQMSTLNEVEVIEMLKAKVKDGVEVKIVLSDISKQLKNAEAKNNNLKLLDEMRESGIDIQIFSNEQLARQTDQYNPENHRKIVVVDSKVGYLGSANINPYVDNYDLGVLINNKLAKELNNYFIHDFSYSSSRRLSDFERFFVNVKNTKFNFLHGKELRSTMIQRVRDAQESIDIAIYDLKDDALINVLVAKKLEKPELDINVVLGPAWKHRTWKGRDISPPQNEKAFSKLTKVGAKVRWAGKHLEQTESIVHAKTMIVDQRYVIGGSSDFNMRSFEGNQELSYEVISGVLGKEFSESIRKEVISGSNKRIHSKSDLLKGKMIEKVTEFMAFLRSGKRHFIDKIVWHPAYLRLKLRKMAGKFFKLSTKVKNYKFGSRNIVNSNPVVARARFYKTLSRLKSIKGKPLKVVKEKRITSDLVTKKSKYFFAGYHTRGLEEIEDQGFVATKGGFYGDGVYLASSPETAIDYSLSRAFQEQKHDSKAHILLIKAKIDKVYIPERDSDLYDAWIKERVDLYADLTPDELMEKFLKTNGYNAIRIIGAEGPKADYFLFLNPSDISIVNQFQIE